MDTWLKFPNDPNVDGIVLAVAELASSDAPLVYLYEYHTGNKAVVLSVIGMFAIINGALIQMIMASRVLYGMGSRGQLPQQFAEVNQRTRTPLNATALVTGIVLILALAGGLATLAEITSIIMLSIFSLVNLALWRVKLKTPEAEGVWVFPLWIPVTAFIASSVFVLIAMTNVVS